MMADGKLERDFTLLTGATGMVGGFLLADLLRSRLPVAVLVRARGRQSASQRLEATMQQLEAAFDRNFLRPVLIQGDLTQDDLGLSEADRQWVATHCRRVIHSAASVSFKPAANDPDNEPFRTNLDGTRRLLTLCEAAGIDEWHHISTAYVSGLRTDLIREDDPLPAGSFGNDYEHSKSDAEQMLRRSAALPSLTVYRPSIVIDEQALMTTQNDQTISSALSMFETLARTFGMPAPGQWLAEIGLDGRERKNIVTAGWTARTIIQIVRRPQLHGRTYHLTNERGIAVDDIERALYQAIEESGVAARGSNGRQPRASLDDMAAPYLAAFGSYFRDDPTFDRSNLLAALRACAQPACPVVDEVVMLQLAQRQLSQRTRNGRKPTKSPFSKWQTLVSGSADDALRAGRPDIALILSGPCGGQWNLACEEGRVHIISGSIWKTSQTLYTSTQTWDEILSGSRSLSSAVSEGLALIESDLTEINPDQLTEIVDALRHQLAESCSPATIPEVVHAD